MEKKNLSEKLTSNKLLQTIFLLGKDLRLLEQVTDK